MRTGPASLPDATTAIAANTCDPTQSGVFIQNLSTWQGCDSLVTLTLTVLTATQDAKHNPLNVNVFPIPFSQQLWVEFELAEPAA